MLKVGVSAPNSTIRVIISNIVYVCNLLILIFLFFFPRDVLSAAREGLMLWFNNVLPALLPFIVVVNMLAALGFVRLVSTWASPFMTTVFRLPGAGGFAFITGLISGYPLGAKTVADLCKAGEITSKEAQRLLAFCNNAGPLFIVGVVGVGLLESSAAGYVLWVGHVAAALVIGIITRRQATVCEKNKMSFSDRKGLKKQVTFRQAKGEVPNIGKALGEAVKNAMEALLLVGGLIIFFSVIVRIMMIAIGDLPFMAGGVLAGVMEITGGVKTLSDTSAGVVTPARMAAIGGIIAFGGFSVHAQALHFTSGIGIKAGSYLFYKTLNGVIAAGITGVAWWIIEGYMI